ncbi:putative oxidoreductase, aldo/keto reductase family [Aeropyrum pernix]|uniref:Putative oxidoreductase, aldo/keto reductase family n=1 Tax=Aeropyrum pernix TaxID=56636 RepID=A0A401H7Y5_AERPX|nr:aldo/keto reductase [Aeropyrum pernix]GBF08490.1 putative oxidoreductase, aldo/keto reductase family [Aeropyrum pernix]
MPLFPIDYNDFKPIGKTKERLSAVGLGTWAIRDYSSALEAYVYAIERGINHIDTAEMYGAGEAERFVGSVLRSVGRDRVYVVTKLYPFRFRDPDEAVKAARASAERMGVSYVDIILIHWPDPQTPIKDQVKSLEAIAEAGLARYIGVSNFSKEQLEEALTATKKHEIVVNQVKYSVLDRRAEELIPLAVEKSILLEAYSPLERGHVAEVRLLAKIGRQYGKTPVQVALNFIVSRPNFIAIPKAERREHVDEILGSLGWRLKPEDIELIEEKL